MPPTTAAVAHNLYSDEELVLVPQSAIDRALGVANHLPHATIRFAEAAAQHPRLRALPAVLRRGDRTDTQTHSEHGRVAVAVVVSHSCLPCGNHERPA